MKRIALNVNLVVTIVVEDEDDANIAVVQFNEYIKDLRYLDVVESEVVTYKELDISKELKE